VSRRPKCPIHVFSSLIIVLDDGSGYCGACRARVQPHKVEEPKPNRLTAVQARLGAKPALKERATKKGK
jgi:hypothetical protein